MNLNAQPTAELRQFQKLVVQDLYIKQLNNWVDILQWENEKKEALIEMHETKISELEKSIRVRDKDILKVKQEFNDYIKKVKSAKVNLEKENKQQEIIDELRHELSSLKTRLQISHKLNTLLTKQR